MPELRVRLYGKLVLLTACEWVRWAPCGCPRAVLTAAFASDPDHVYATEAQVWRHWYPRARDRERAQRRGVRVELMSHTRYVAKVYPLMLGSCPHQGTP